MAPAPGEPLRVTRVVDGDTLQVGRGGSRWTVRLIGVDAPELPHGKGAGEYLAREARAFVQQRVDGVEVLLERDLRVAERDGYGRLLRMVKLPDGQLLNEDLIRQGLAHVLRRFPFDAMERFARLESEARAAGRGLWADGGRAELRFELAAGRRPARLHATADHRWAIEFGGRVKPHLRRSELLRELDRLRSLRDFGPAEVEQALDETGYIEWTPGP